MDKKLNTDKLETLRQGVERGIINLASVEVFLEEMNRQEILAKHEHKIWQNETDGKWRTYIPDASKPKGLKLVCKKERKALEDAIVAFYEELEKAEKIYTFEDAFHDCYDRLLERGGIKGVKGIKPGTYRSYAITFRRVFANAEIGKMDLSKTTPEMWEDFLEDMVTRFDVETCRLARIITKGALKRANKYKHTDFRASEIFENLEPLHKDSNPKDTEEVYTPEEVEKLEPYLIKENSLPSLGLLLLFVSGLRIGELVVLYQTDFSQDYTLSVTKTETIILEDGKQKCVVGDSPKTPSGNRVVPIPKKYHWVVDAIRQQFSDSTVFAFKSRKSKSHITRFTFGYHLKKACEACGIEYKSLHKIRKTYCSKLYDENVNPKIMAKLAGHKNLSTTLSYYNKDRTNDTEKAECVNMAFG